MDFWTSAQEVKVERVMVLNSNGSEFLIGLMHGSSHTLIDTSALFLPRLHIHQLERMALS